MKTNQASVIRLAVILIILIFIASVFISFSGMAGREQYTQNVIWRAAAQTAESVNVTDLTGDDERDVFVQAADGFAVLDADGQPIFSQATDSTPATTQGDVNGDGTPDIIAFTLGGDVTAYTGEGTVLWHTTLDEAVVPGRVLALDFDNDGRSETIVGDEGGTLVALSANGDYLWTYRLSGSGILRGLDEVQVVSGDLVTAGLEGGLVVVLDSQGHELWRTQADAGLRRLRAFPLGGPVNGRVFVGGVGGTLAVHQPDDGGQRLWAMSIGQAVNEIRPGEVDGDPATTEVLVGGKDGGVWAFTQDGRQLWSGSLSGKVGEIASMNLPDLGTIVLFGDEFGGVTAYSPEGKQLFNFDVSGEVLRLEEGRLGRNRGVVVSDGREIIFYTFASETAPFWYTPIVAGLIACLIVAGVAYFLMNNLQPAPTLQVSAQQMSVEAQKAPRRMLHESINDLNMMQEQGSLADSAYLARKKQLREQLAPANQNLLTLGESIQPETITCPHCNGTLELGTDRCDYCGQIVIT
jgi:hypothetical protein